MFDLEQTQCQLTAGTQVLHLGREGIFHIRQAASDAISFVEGLSKDEFLEDRRTQQAVVMSLIIIGQASTNIMDLHPDFTAVHVQMPRRSVGHHSNCITRFAETPS